MTPVEHQRKLQYYSFQTAIKLELRRFNDLTQLKTDCRFGPVESKLRTFVLEFRSLGKPSKQIGQ